MSRRRMIQAGAAAHTSPPTEPPPEAGRSFTALYWLFGLITLGAALAIGVWGAWWLYFNLVISITIADQPTGVMLPEEFDATVEVTNKLDVAMKGQITTSVPFKETLTVPFRGRYDFDVTMNAQVPVQFVVDFDGILPVDTQADVTIRTGINYKNLKALRNLEIQTTLPLKFPLPVKLNIPVDDVIDLTYTGPLSADINQDVKTLVDTTLKTSLPIDQTISTPVTAALPLKVRPDQQQVRLILSRMIVDLQPAQMLTFGVAEDRDGPVRVDNPWGPLDDAPPRVGAVSSGD